LRPRDRLPDAPVAATDALLGFAGADHDRTSDLLAIGWTIADVAVAGPAGEALKTARRALMVELNVLKSTSADQVIRLYAEHKGLDAKAHEMVEEARGR
jgi:hypothetical protein